MTTRQKITLEQSEKRQRLNEILAKDTKTAEERAELETLTKRMQELEPELRAAIVAEGEEETRAAAQFGDGETAERRALLRRVSMADYLTAATARMAPQGAAAELNASAGRGRGRRGRRGVYSVGRAPGRGTRGRSTSTRKRGPSPTRRQTMEAKCNGRFCNGCSGRVSWICWASVLILSRSVAPNGRCSMQV